MFSLAFNRQVMKDTNGNPTIMKEVNYVFRDAAQEGGYYSDELVDNLIESGTLKGVDEVPSAAQDVFVTAHDITPEWHMRMQAAFQQNCDSSISKTINFPHEATADDVRSIYELAIDLDVKGVTVYRDGCREMQPMALANSDHESTPEGEAPMAKEDEYRELVPVRLPEIMSCLRVRQMTPFGNMHIKVTVDPTTGLEREVFAQLGKGGDVANSDLEAICRMLSLWLRGNGSLERAIGQFSGIGSSLTVPTKDGRIMSLADGLATGLQRYLAAKESHGLRRLLLGGHEVAEVSDEIPMATGRSHLKKTGGYEGAPQNVGGYKLKCPSCTYVLAFQEGCVKCHSCGFSQC